MLVTPAGDVYITGALVRNGNPDLFLAKYSRGGALRWVKYLAGSAGVEDQGNALARDGKGDLYVAGFVTRTGTGRDHVLVKYRPDGRRMWVKGSDSGLSSDDWANDVAIRGAFVVLAGGATDADGDTCAFAARYDTAGKLWWMTVRDTSGAGDSEYMEAGVDRYGHTIAAGHKDFDIGQGLDAVLARFEPAGDLDWEWFKRGSGDDDRVAGLAVTTEGVIYVTGYYKTAVQGYDVFLTELRPGGSYVAQSFWDWGSGVVDDGAVALTLTGSSVYLAGMSGNAALVMKYRRSPF